MTTHLFFNTVYKPNKNIQTFFSRPKNRDLWLHDQNH